MEPSAQEDATGNTVVQMGQEGEVVPKLEYVYKLDPGDSEDPEGRRWNEDS